MKEKRISEVHYPSASIKYQIIADGIIFLIAVVQRFHGLAARRILDTGAGQQRRLMNLASQAISKTLMKHPRACRVSCSRRSAASVLHCVGGAA